MTRPLSRRRYLGRMIFTTNALRLDTSPFDRSSLNCEGSLFVPASKIIEHLLALQLDYSVPS